MNAWISQRDHPGRSSRTGTRWTRGWVQSSSVRISAHDARLLNSAAYSQADVMRVLKEEPAFDDTLVAPKRARKNPPTDSDAPKQNGGGGVPMHASLYSLLQVQESTVERLHAVARRTRHPRGSCRRYTPVERLCTASLCARRSLLCVLARFACREHPSLRTVDEVPPC